MRAVLGKDPTRAPQSELNLPPGFRFCPTDEELVVHYLCRKAACEPFAVPIIAEVELYKFNPWDLPAKALFGEREWYFFSPRDRKYPNGSRPNRAAGGGYWKATGTDKPISSCGGKKKVGVKKALVFYKGKAPRGLKTNWIMHEYRLADTGKSTYRPSATKKATLRLDDWVLCRIYKKSLSEANQGKDVSDSLDDVLVERSESSALDDVLAALTELDGPANAAQGEAEVDDADMTQFVGALETQNSRALLHNSLKELCYEPAASAYSEAGGRRDDAEEIEGGGRLESSSGGSGEADACSFVRPERAVTPESFIRPQSAAMQETIARIRQSSPPQQSWHTTEKQEGEETAMERSLHELAHLPLTQLLNTAINTQNLGMASSSIFGIDLGLPSPCTLLAQGAAFGANLSMDPDNFLFLSPRLTAGEPCKSCF